MNLTARRKKLMKVDNKLILHIMCSLTLYTAFTLQINQYKMQKLVIHHSTATSIGQRRVNEIY